jgi:hypothetical protein
MRKVAARVLAILLLGATVILVLYGLLALLFNERGGATCVLLAGHRFDAHATGAVGLGVAAVLAVLARLVSRRTA